MSQLALPTENVSTEKISRYGGSTAKVTGIVIIFCGVLEIISNSAGLLFEGPVMHFGTGIWVGALLIVTGAFGIVAGNRKASCPIMTYFVMCVISTVVVTFAILQSAVGLAVSNYVRRWKNTSYILTNLVMLLAGVTAFICAIWGSALFCKIHCLCCHDNLTEPMYTGAELRQAGVDGQSTVILIPAANIQNPIPGTQGQPYYVTVSRQEASSIIQQFYHQPPPPALLQQQSQISHLQQQQLHSAAVSQYPQHRTFPLYPTYQQQPLYQQSQQYPPPPPHQQQQLSDYSHSSKCDDEKAGDGELPVTGSDTHTQTFTSDQLATTSAASNSSNQAPSLSPPPSYHQ